MDHPNNTDCKVSYSQRKHESCVSFLNIRRAISLILMLNSHIQVNSFFLKNRVEASKFSGLPFWNHRYYWGLEEHTRWINWRIRDNDQSHDIELINPRLKEFLVDVWVWQHENPLLRSKLFWSWCHFIKAFLLGWIDSIYVAEESIDWYISNEVLVVNERLQGWFSKNVRWLNLVVWWDVRIIQVHSVAHCE